MEKIKRLSTIMVKDYGKGFLEKGNAASSILPMIRRKNLKKPSIKEN
ncbi:hypothetical protein ACFW1P_09960 [Paenibacillus sp. NPDC058910]